MGGWVMGGGSLNTKPQTNTRLGVRRPWALGFLATRQRCLEDTGVEVIGQIAVLS